MSNGQRESNALLVGASEVNTRIRRPWELNEDLAACYNEAKRMQGPPDKWTDPGRSIWQLELLGHCLYLSELSHGMWYTDEVMQAAAWSSGDSNVL